MGVKNSCFQSNAKERYVHSFLFPSYIRPLFLPTNVIRHPTSTHPCVCAVDGVGKVSAISNRKGRDNRYLSDKIMIHTNVWPGISVAITWSLIRYSENFSLFFDRISYGKIHFSLFFHGDLVFIYRHIPFFTFYLFFDTVWKSPKTHGVSTKKQVRSTALLWSVSIASP